MAALVLASRCLLIPNKLHRGRDQWNLIFAASTRLKQLAAQPDMDNPRAILLLVYQHCEPPMTLPKGAEHMPSSVSKALLAAKQAGLEVWQVPSPPLHTHDTCFLTCREGFGELLMQFFKTAKMSSFQIIMESQSYVHVYPALTWLFFCL